MLVNKYFLYFFAFIFFFFVFLFLFISEEVCYNGISHL